MHMHLEAVPAKLLPAEDTKSEKENGKIKRFMSIGKFIIDYLHLLEDVTLEIFTSVFFFFVFVFCFLLFFVCNWQLTGTQDHYAQVLCKDDLLIHELQEFLYSIHSRCCHKYTSIFLWQATYVSYLSTIVATSRWSSSTGMLRVYTLQ